jgi:hypothetical protein
LSYVLYFAFNQLISSYPLPTSDKCVCGAITSDKGASGTCYFTNQAPDDDTLSFSCSSRSQIKFQGNSWTLPSSVSAAADFSVATMTTMVIDADGSDDTPV